MKKNFLSISIFMLAALFGSKHTQAQITLSGVISTNRVLTSDNVYLIDGKVFVQGGATLFIEEGTIIKGVKKATPAESSTLVITRTGRIEANGSPENPIVFTSNAAVPVSGDWGGIVILGSAPLNRVDATIEGINGANVPAGTDITYGGGGAGLGNAAENKGTLNYVRIEYAGAIIAPNNELNGLTGGGVGRGTFIDFVQVVYGADDAFEFFGGTVNLKHLIALAPDDDAFDFDFGYTGNIQFAVSVLSPNKSAYSSDPNGNEVDNDATGTAAAPRTKPTISNMTVIGMEDSTTAGVLGKKLKSGGNYRRNSSYQIRNSVYMGFPVGMLFESAGTIADIANFNNNIVHGFRAAAQGATPNASNTLITGEVGFSNETIDLVDPFNPTFPDFRPSGSSPARNGASFPVPGTILPANFFQTTTYRGAFSLTTNWNATWSRFF